ncbi:hypothetical protein [Phyllobacterium brassicacearum]|uniref:hypothetical protein n=1 Tax=Phyllobacterium brassicacearum TaxID=314235 RepID=UPI001FE00D7A|nr:hypothetical protein [Phyllobacterium brassicacearum]
MSCAINTPNLVKPTTLEAIERVIARTGYVPNFLAGGLRPVEPGCLRPSFHRCPARSPPRRSKV